MNILKRSGGNVHSDDDGSEEKESELCVKLPRLQLHRLKLPARGKSLCDLPSEILEKIIGYVDIWHHNRIRATSRRMRYITDLSTMHGYQKALQENSDATQNSYKSAVLRSINQATDVYVKFGFETLFCGLMLPMLRSCYKDPFCPSMQKVEQFLKNFYRSIEDRLRVTQEFDLLYVLTFLRFLNALPSSHAVVSSFETSKWKCIVELNGPWLGTMWTSKTRLPLKSENQTKLLIIMAEILLADISGEAFKRVISCDNEICIFGYDASDKKHRPKTRFAFSLHGSKEICSLFHSCLEEDEEKFTWPSVWPKHEFMFDLIISSTEATKWGCSENKRIELGNVIASGDSAPKLIN
uniref:F-box domain-containing protein n=1 Tax=Glossina brevipalpis TaxID=37001 RepID=A0A1A9W9T3_9MUSC